MYDSLGMSVCLRTISQPQTNLPGLVSAVLHGKTQLTVCWGVSYTVVGTINKLMKVLLISVMGS